MSTETLDRQTDFTGATLEPSPRQQPQILVVVPAYNESARLRNVLQAIQRQSLSTADILVIDDGSRDATSAEALRAGAIAARHPFNLGCGAALQTGYKFALERGYDYIIQIDADGQHDPDCLAAVLAPTLEGKADVVIGSRFLWAGGYRSPIERRVGSWLFGQIATFLTGTRITDPTSGYRAMNRKALALCAHDSFPHDYPDADVLINLHRAGVVITEVPALMHPRRGGHSMHRGLRPLYYMFKMSLSIFVALLRKAPSASV
jgi:glycosyltransferase involved in cell wall biosynthesis